MEQTKKTLQEKIEECLKTNPENPTIKSDNPKIESQEKVKKKKKPFVKELSNEKESFLQYVQRCWPLKSAYWEKMEVLTISQAILLYYNIEPSTQNPYAQSLFSQFIQEGDQDHLWDLMRGSIGKGSLTVVDSHPTPSISTEKFCSWLSQKELPIPKVFSKIDFLSSHSPIQLKTIKDVDQIDYNRLPLSVLKSLGANCIAQMCQRADAKKNKKLTISTVIKDRAITEFFNDCATIEDKTIGDDTIREYIEKQFKN